MPEERFDAGKFFTFDLPDPDKPSPDLPDEEHREFLKKRRLKEGQINELLKKKVSMPHDELEWLNAPLSGTGNRIREPSEMEFEKKSKYDLWLDQLAEERWQYEKEKGEPPPNYTQDYDRWQLADEHRSAKAIGANYDQSTIDEQVRRPEREEMMNNQIWQTLRTQSENLWNNVRQLESENAVHIGQQGEYAVDSPQWKSLQGLIDNNNAKIDEINELGNKLNMELDYSRAPDRFARLNFSRRQAANKSDASPMHEGEDKAISDVINAMKKAIGRTSVTTTADIKGLIDKTVKDPEMRASLKSKLIDHFKKEAESIKAQKEDAYRKGVQYQTDKEDEDKRKGRYQHTQNKYDDVQDFIAGGSTYKDFLRIKTLLADYEINFLGTENGGISGFIEGIVGEKSDGKTHANMKKEYDQYYKQNAYKIAAALLKKLEKEGAKPKEGGNK
jgi:hypothetical protein